MICIILIDLVEIVPFSIHTSVIHSGSCIAYTKVITCQKAGHLIAQFSDTYRYIDKYSEELL